MRATGLLPIGGRGSLTFHDVELEAETFLAKVRDYGRPELRTIDVTVQGVRVFGEIPGVTAKAIVYGRLARTRSKYRLRALLFHVFGALQRAADPTQSWPERTVLLTKDKQATLAPLALAEAAEFAHMLIMGYREGLAQPLPVFEDASETFAKTLAAQREKVDEDRAQRVAARAAKTAFEPDFTGEFPTGDSIDADVALCWRGRDPISDARFIGWASTLWGQLLELETS
jgi:exonuclease V gamma subunit